jgi:hypothetical protein
MKITKNFPTKLTLKGWEIVSTDKDWERLKKGVLTVTVMYFNQRIDVDVLGKIKATNITPKQLEILDNLLNQRT